MPTWIHYMKGRAPTVAETQQNDDSTYDGDDNDDDGDDDGDDDDDA